MKKTYLISVKLSLMTKIRKEDYGHVWGKSVPDLWLCFCPEILLLCLSILFATIDYVFQLLFLKSQVFWCEVCVAPYTHQEYEQGNSNKKLGLNLLGQTSGDDKV